MDGKAVKCEGGASRTADLEAAARDPQVAGQNKKPQYQSGEASFDSVQDDGQPLRKNVELKDKWDAYRVQFSLFDPLYEEDDVMLLELGAGQQVVQMQRTSSPQNWLPSKYGEPVPLWECVIHRTNAD